MIGPARFLTAAALAIVPIAALLYAGEVLAQQETAAQTAEPVQIAQAATVGPKVCLECHNKPPVTHVLHGSMGQTGDSRTPFAKDGCETCHGPSAEHADDPSVPVPVMFGPKSPTPATKQNEVCLSCHQDGLRMNWQASTHAANDLTCNGCHDVHAAKDKVQARATQPDVCFGCHKQQRADSKKRSHHPIQEGKVVCSDCHNPHGSFGPSQLKQNTVNETCFQCHADKRGPFLWEHAPVADNCANCHKPHGSAQPRMLKARAPMLCQQCHNPGGHPSRLYDGQYLPNTGSTSSSVARLAGKSCMNCHPQVHGSNHPSGVRLRQ